MNLTQAIERLRAAGVDNPRLDARLLWEFATKFPPACGRVAERSEGFFGEGTAARYETLIARRAAREPLAYITGRKEFWSLDLAVGPGCLIPRPDTETLIETLTRKVPDRSRPFSILDLGTGSGCLLIAALTEYPHAHGTGIDRSPEALAWARRNVEQHGLAGRAALVQGDWPDVVGRPYDVILANPPYIPTGEIDRLEPEVARFEPSCALDGGPDGQDAYRALAPRLVETLAPTGLAIIEIGQGQGGAVLTLMVKAGLEVLEIVPDLAQIPRAMVVKSRNRPIQKNVGKAAPSR